MKINLFNWKRRNKKKKFKIPTEEEYYASIVFCDPNTPGFTESDREAIRMLKECPIPYELIKKAFTGE